MRFRVEGCWSQRGIVFARQLELGSFTITASSTLGGYAVKALDIAREPALAPDRRLFGFFLDRPSDVIHFARGQEIELT